MMLHGEYTNLDEHCHDANRFLTNQIGDGYRDYGSLTTSKSLGGGKWWWKYTTKCAIIFIVIFYF